MKQMFLTFITQMLAVFIAISIVNAQVDWRFGLEWSEGTLLGWNDPVLEKLLTKLEKLGTAGGINVNGQGSWAIMQSSPSAEINWGQNDAIVKLFGCYGFSLTWYLNCNAPWAFPNKPQCQPETLQTPFGNLLFYKNCAPEPEFEPHWINYVKTIVERYDGDGIDDMPGLVIPVQFYILPGEIKFGISSTGDEEQGPFWYDSIDGLLRVHRMTHTAVHEADPGGLSRVVSSGAVFWDLFADFPDHPQFDPPDSNSTIQRRLRGENYRSSTYTAGWDSIKKMLDSFGNDADGIECDYIGWHPHFNWRVIDQEFALIHHHAGDKPIYVDDMWSNIFSSGYYLGISIPGGAQFHAQPWPPSNTDWIKAIEGDFPNALFASNDPYHELYTGLFNKDSVITAWYYATGARNLVKSFVSAFGEGAERASFSGTNDAPELRNWRWGSGGWINLTDTRQVNYAEKPQYYTYKLLIEKLNDFTTVSEVPASNNPLTRVYKFDRPAGPIYVLWSETGDAPPDLDYRIPTGETVTFKVESDTLLLTHIITDTANTIPGIETLIAENRQVNIKLGYEPIFLEPILPVDVKIADHSVLPSSFVMEQNYPNPFNPATTFEFVLPKSAFVTLKVYNLLGEEVATLVAEQRTAGIHKLNWDARGLASGVYLYRLEAGSFIQTKKLILMR